MNRIKTSVYLLIITVLIAGLSACDQLIQLLSDGDMPTTGSEAPQMYGVSGEIPVGMVYPVTGRLANFALPIYRGFELAVEEINNAQLGDARIKFIIEDDLSAIEGVVDAYQKLIEQDNVPVIFGPTTSPQAEAAFPIAQQNQVVAFSSSSNKVGLSALGDYLFRAGLTTDKIIPPGIRASHTSLGYQRVAIIYDEADSYSIDSHEKFRDTLTELGVTIVATETFKSSEEIKEPDFSAQLTRIIAVNPDAIFIAAQQPELTPIQIQGRQLGIPSSVRYITSLISDVENAGAAAEGSISFAGWIATADAPGNQAFVEKYRARYQSEPNPWTAQSYASVYILAEAISRAQSTDAGAIRDALASIQDYETILGKFSFNNDGDAVYAPVVLSVIENGEFAILK